MGEVITLPVGAPVSRAAISQRLFDAEVEASVARRHATAHLSLIEKCALEDVQFHADEHARLTAIANNWDARARMLRTLRLVSNTAQEG